MSPNIIATIYAKESLTKIKGRPSAIQVHRLKQEMMANAASIKSVEHPKYGHVGMLLDTQQYAQYCNDRDARWSEPLDPGEHPNINDLMTATQLEIAKFKFESRKADYDRYQAGVQSTRSQFIATFEDDTYYKGVLEPGQNIMALSPGELLYYMTESYGTMSWVERAANRRKLDDPWDGTGTVQEMMDRYEEIAFIHQTAGSALTKTDLLDAMMVQLNILPEFQETIRRCRAYNARNWDYECITNELKEVCKGRDITTAGTSIYNANAAAGLTKPAPSTEAPVFNTGRRLMEVGPGEMIISYCSTHGFQSDRTHHSRSCDKVGPEHNKRATCWKQGNGCMDFVVPLKYRIEPSTNHTLSHGKPAAKKFKRN